MIIALFPRPASGIVDHMFNVIVFLKHKNTISLFRHTVSVLPLEFDEITWYY